MTSVTESVKRQFLEIYAHLGKYTQEDVLSGDDASIRPWFGKLNQLAATDVDDRDAELLCRDPELQPVISHISELKRCNGFRVEMESARAVIQADDPVNTLEAFVYFSNYLKLADMEYQGGRLRQGDRVVFLGSGPLPLSLISFYRRHGIRGIGIEQSPEITALSRELLQRLGLEKHIQIIQGSHFSLPLDEPCGLLMIGADALPKAEIFSHLASVLENGTRLSYRIYEKGLRRLMDTQSGFELPPGFREYDRVRPEPPVNNTSVFVLKEG